MDKSEESNQNQNKNKNNTYEEPIRDQQCSITDHQNPQTNQNIQGQDFQGSDKFISQNVIEDYQRKEKRKQTHTKMVNSKVFGSIQNENMIKIKTRKTGLDNYKTQKSIEDKNKQKEYENQIKQREKLEKIQQQKKNSIFQSVNLQENEVYKLNCLQILIRMLLGIVSSMSVACDIILILELWDFKEKREIAGSWDYQFYIMLCITIFTCFVGHCLGNQQPMEQGMNIDYPNNKIAKLLFRLFGLIGLSPIVYFFYSSISRKASKQQDDYCMLQLGPRRWWAHWQSILSCFISSHFMYTTGEHTVWVVIGFIMNSCNACLSFIEYTGYTDQLDQDHRYCEDCMCNEDLMKYTKEFPFPFKTYKNVILQCKYCKQYFDKGEDFLYCGCKKHIICLHKQCKKIAQKKDKKGNIVPYDHRFQKPFNNFIAKNYQYLLMFPEIFARPLFFGITALITIEQSNFTDAQPVKLTYDFFIWDSIIMGLVLFVPYIVYILIKDSQNIRLASILIFYSFYYAQILRVPFREYTLLQYNQQLILMSFIKKESKKLENSKQLNQLYDLMKKQLKLDQFNGILNIMEDQLNLDLLIQYFPHIISFLGYFPVIWRIGEFIALFIIVIALNFTDVLEQSEVKNMENITNLTIFWNIIAILTLLYSIIEFTQLRQRIKKINRDWKNQKGKIYEYYTSVGQKQIEKKKQQHRSTMFQFQDILQSQIHDIDNEKAADYIYQHPVEFSNVVHSVNTELQQKATKQSSSQESGNLTQKQIQQQKVIQCVDILDKNLNEYKQDFHKEGQTKQEQEQARVQFAEKKGQNILDNAMDKVIQEVDNQLEKEGIPKLDESFESRDINEFSDENNNNIQQHQKKESRYNYPQFKNSISNVK